MGDQTVSKIVRLVKKSVRMAIHPRRSLRTFKRVAARLQFKRHRQAAYVRWFEGYQAEILAAHADQTATADNFAHKPLISILVPVYNPPHKFLRACIESVQAQ